MKTYLEQQYLNENMMGPNAITLLKELSCQIPLEPSMRVLDLGCGRGLTSAYLADTFGVQVFALDLWIPATENYLRFRELGLDSRIIPLHGDAGNMPFAEEYFDAVVSVDSYHYFGRDEKYMDSCLAPLVKHGGLIALALPGLKKELTDGLPPEMALSWTEEDIETSTAPAGGRSFFPNPARWNSCPCGKWIPLTSAGRTGLPATIPMPSATAGPWRPEQGST